MIFPPVRYKEMAASHRMIKTRRETMGNRGGISLTNCGHLRRHFILEGVLLIFLCPKSPKEVTQLNPDSASFSSLTMRAHRVNTSDVDLYMQMFMV